VLSDEQLMGLMNRAISNAGQGSGRVADTRDLRTRLAARPETSTPAAVEPAECGAFRAHTAPTAPADLRMHFAAGVLSLTGAWSREAVAFLLARSAPRTEVIAADFAYSEEQSGKCATFLQAGVPDAEPSTVRVFPVSEVGERAYATVVVPPDTAGARQATVSLQVLVGNISFGLARQAAATASDDELRAALQPLLRLAKELAAAAAAALPTEPAPGATTAAASAAPTAGTPGNAPLRTPQQRAGLLQGVTGPHGDAARVLKADYVPTGAAPEPPAEACTFDDPAYLATLGGAPRVAAEFSGTSNDPERIGLRLIGVAGSAAGSFDDRAAALGSCGLLQEKVPGAGTRPWTSVVHLQVSTGGQAGYALAYLLPDGTGVRHVLVGARKNGLCVEAETAARSDSGVQQAADGLAATVNKVLAKVGS
jgi:hypothetical protein